MSTASLIKQTRSRLADPIFGGSPGDATAFDVAVTGLDDDNAKRLVEVLSMNPADPNRIAMLERFKTKKPKQWNDALSNLYLGA